MNTLHFLDNKFLSYNFKRATYINWQKPMDKLILALFLSIPIGWLGWATFSDGHYYNLTLEPDGFRPPDKDLAYILSNIDYSDGSETFDKLHVEMCSYYMPNWKKTRACVETRKACLAVVPNLEKHKQPFAEKYFKCWNIYKPKMGFKENMREYRAKYRAYTVFVTLWLLDLLYNIDSLTPEEESVFIKNHPWVEEMFIWLQKGR